MMMMMTFDVTVSKQRDEITQTENLSQKKEIKRVKLRVIKINCIGLKSRRHSRCRIVIVTVSRRQKKLWFFVILNKLNFFLLYLNACGESLFVDSREYKYI